MSWDDLSGEVAEIFASHAGTTWETQAHLFVERAETVRRANDSIRERVTEWHARARQHGRCVFCGISALPGVTTCIACRDRHRERTRAKRRTASTKIYRCGCCGELGHNRRACPSKIGSDLGAG